MLLGICLTVSQWQRQPIQIHQHDRDAMVSSMGCLQNS